MERTGTSTRRSSPGGLSLTSTNLPTRTRLRFVSACFVCRRRYSWCLCVPTITLTQPRFYCSSCCLLMECARIMYISPLARNATAVHDQKRHSSSSSEHFPTRAYGSAPKRRSSITSLSSGGSICSRCSLLSRYIFSEVLEAGGGGLVSAG